MSGRGTRQVDRKMALSFRKRQLRHGLLLALFLLVLPVGLGAQDWLRAETGLGVAKTRVGVADFVGRDGASEPWAALFSAVVRSDLDHSGVLELVNRSLYPPDVPAVPGQLSHAEWSTPALMVEFLAFGNVTVGQRNFSIEAWLYDIRNSNAPPVVVRVFAAEASDAQIRKFAHQFADEIVARLSGVNGIASTQIAFVSARGNNKEIWVMDYDGAGQRQLTFLDSIALTPRWSPDCSRIAFTCYQASGTLLTPQICVYSNSTSRPNLWMQSAGINAAPAWSPDGAKIMFTSSRFGNPELFIAEADGNQARQVTNSMGANVSAVFDPVTGNRVIFVSDRGGLPQLYMMNADGRDAQKLPLPGLEYVVDPAWSPNGKLLTFSSRRLNGNFDLYVMDLASRQLIELTRDAGRNERPSWAPDGRHIVFESTRTGVRQIWSILADGTRPRQLTAVGQNESPNWSPDAVH
jgi:TolB protein